VTAPTSNIVVRARPSSLARVRRWLNKTLVDRGASESARSDLALAVTELCTNIIRYGYRGADGTIEVSATVSGQTFEVTVVDQAPVFALPQFRTTAAGEALREGGFGIPLIQALVDEIRHEALGERGNRVRLVKYREARDAP